jgi:hypothetical protein
MFIIHLRRHQFLLLVKGAIKPRFANFLLVPKLRMSGTAPSLPSVCLHDLDRDRFTFTFTRVRENC